MSTTALSIDESKLNAFMAKVIGELGAAMSASMVIIGDKLGLYKAMSDSRPEELAQKNQH